jgi:hypothetical protein
VLAQSESHIYRDSLDCVETLSHLNMVLEEMVGTPATASREGSAQRSSAVFSVNPFSLQS